MRTRAQARGLDGRIQTLVADMHALPLRSAAFDLIWSEGAIYIMGFEAGLTHWRNLLRPRGWLVVSELSWLTDHPPAALRDYWREGYPGMRPDAQAVADMTEREIALMADAAGICGYVFYILRRVQGGGTSERG